MVNLQSATVAALVVALTGFGTAGACTLQTVGELNVDLSRSAPVVDGAINGAAVRMMIDTGSTGTTIMAPAARRLGLPKDRLAQGSVLQIGGQTEHYMAAVKALRIGTLTMTALPPMLVGGRIRDEPDIAMLIGSDFLSQFDVELDFANHVMRLFHADGCAPGQLVYWGKPYSQAALLAGDAIETEVALNGRRALAWLDTGATRSLVEGGSAAAAGEPPPKRTELEGGGLGPLKRETWVDVFDSFQIGDERIEHAIIEVSPFSRDFEISDSTSFVAHRVGDTPGMLVGDDFLKAHRVMVDFHNHVMVFSYNGGPIFSTAAPEPSTAR